MVDISHLNTEARNEKTMNLDEMSTVELLTVLNEEDTNPAKAVKLAIGQIAEAVELTKASLRKNARMIYIGAGTSGRMGLMDAVECVPTFSSENVIGLIAGGEGAFIKAVEGAEDSKELAVEDLKKINLTKDDTVIGIAASGRTPYVIGGLDYAHSIEASTVSVACNTGAEISKHADVAIEVNAGPEILTGSTRLKSGTCQKLICNMLSTATMVGIGKVYKNLMVDMKPTNLKLEERARRITMMATGCEREVAEKALTDSHNNMKVAIVMILENITKEEAEARLEKADGYVRKALD